MILPDVTIYVVADDEAVRDSLQALLETVGLKVEAFGSGRAFIESHHPARRACLLLNLHLPDMSGLQLLETLTAEQVDIPVILMSARLDPGTRNRAIRSGVTALLEKPFDHNLLLDTIWRAVDVDQHAMIDVIATVLEELADSNGSLKPREIAEVCIHVYEELRGVAPASRKDRLARLAGAAIRYTKRARALGLSLPRHGA